MPRKTERYTERARPHRREGPGDGPAANGGWRNPVVMVAVAALVAAGAMGLGLVAGRRPAAQPTASTTEEGAPVTDTLAVSSPFPVDTPVPPTPPGQQFSAPEDQKLDADEYAYFVTIETPHGPIVAELWPELAPETVNSFVFLARKGFYDGLTFHRVEPEFVIQGGDPLGNGTGGPGYSLPAEFSADNPVPHRAGTLAMARAADPNSAGSQFYIVTADSPSASALDGQYTVFGHVISGMAAVRAMQKGDPMSRVTIEEKPLAERVVSPDDIRNGQLPKND